MSRRVRAAKISDVPLACADEAAAVEFLESLRWGDDPCCPRCGDCDVYQMQSRNGGRERGYRWRCRGCKRQFSVRTDTVMEDSRIPLNVWVHAYWRAASSKKGVSALQVKRETGISYKSALCLLHRIRWAMADNGSGPLTGEVEVDDGDRLGDMDEGGGRPGPEPDRVKIDVPYEEGLRRALTKKKPPEGWPKPKESREESEDGEG